MRGTTATGGWGGDWSGLRLFVLLVGLVLVLGPPLVIAVATL